jgi:hypothetical protein
MAIKTSCEIKCLNCEKWFRSAIQFGNAKTFFTSSLSGNNQQCAHCRKMTPCNKENMRFREDDGEGHVTYTDGKDTW